MKNFIIAITRTCGSGGSTIGKILSDRYKINMYDRELLRLASDESGINMSLFEKADENVKKTNLFRAYSKVYNGEIIPPESDDFTQSDNLFNYQAKVLRELSLEESYVVIGRCADYVLQNNPGCVKIFLHAPLPFCVHHEMEKLGLPELDALRTVHRLNKYRRDYYRYHTGNEWYDMSNYDLCVDTSVLGFEKSASLIEEYIYLKGYASRSE